MNILLTTPVSTNNIDITFDDVNIFDGIRKLSEYFQDLANHLPSYERVGLVMGKLLGFFPADFWFCMIICVICLVLSRILRRY